jgi:hypothetical protein
MSASERDKAPFIAFRLAAAQYARGDPADECPRTVTRNLTMSQLAPGFWVIAAAAALGMIVLATAGQAGAAGPPEAPPPRVRVKPAAAEATAAIPSATQTTEVIRLDGPDWLLAVDPKAAGQQQQWSDRPPAEARKARVPGVTQDAFPDYHGWAWYWREFEAPANPHAGGRYLLRWGGVDSRCEVWLNGTRVGAHEGHEEPFVLDATAAVKPGKANRLAVRLFTPATGGRRTDPPSWDAAYCSGGIVDSVELLVAPAVRITDIQVVPDWKTGDLRVLATVRNAGTEGVGGFLQFSVAPAVGGESAVGGVYQQQFAPGDTVAEVTLRVPHPRCWELNDPYLYRVTARVQAARGASFDERSVRCGFRDFRFENGYFRLNGRRIRLMGPLQIILHYPVTQSVALDEDLVRRDVLNMKAVGFNCVRICCGAALPARQLDVFDELGLLVTEGHLGGSSEAYPLERDLAGVVQRDRNHPSIVAWELANEEGNAATFQRLVRCLPLVRDLDDSRMVILNSGRLEQPAAPEIGSISNPGSRVWESDLLDQHSYHTFPLRSWDVRSLRTFCEKHPFLLSEHGVCGAQDYPRYLRHFEQLGKEHAVDARVYREQLDLFMADWKKWRLDECWARPEDYFRQSQANQAKLTLCEYTAWMANPRMVGSFTSTSVSDAWFHGCGITTYFREMKPGMAEVYQDLASKVRLCLFADRANIYRGAKVRLEAVLVNLDALRPGKYPVNLQVVGPKAARVFQKTISVDVPQPEGLSEPPFAQPIFSEEVAIDGASGRYRFLATFQHGAAAGGGEVDFHVADPADMPAVKCDVALWGEDSKELGKWLAERAIRVRPFVAANQTAREVILASGRPPAGDGEAAFAELARHVARGSTVIFLTPETLLEAGKDDGPLRWAPVPKAKRPSLVNPMNWYFRADFWSKEHPVFDGLPCGGIMDYRFYEDILRTKVLRGVQPPAEAVAGAIQASGGSAYQADLLVAVAPLGAGRFLLNSMIVRANLGGVPAAERLLRNMLNYAAQGGGQPAAELPADFAEQLKAMH